jgi:esterase/lipase
MVRSINFVSQFKKATILFSGLLLLGCSTDPEWLKPSGKAIATPEKTLGFEQYVTQTQATIEQVVTQVHFKDKEAKSPFVGGYSASEIAKMRAPFQLPENNQSRCTDQAQGAAKGFLLVHGLTDSPYLLKNMAESLRAQYPCALVRSVLLPGHGTVIGDTLSMSYKQWKNTTDYGVDSFQTEESINELYVVGFSTGTALAIQHVLENTKNSKIKGLILLSTAVKASSGLAWLAPYIKGLKPWVGINKDRDGARYSSFSTNAGAQFYLLTKGMLDKTNQLDIPVLMAVSADDATIDALAARQYFCKNVVNKRKLLVWYEGFSNQAELSCEGILTVAKPALKQTQGEVEYRYANASHTGISVNPIDAHYGVKGKYRDCKAYEKSDDDSQWLKCVDDAGVKTFGEKNIADMPNVLAKGMWRRGTFNKDYDALVEKVMCFTDTQCSTKDLQANK